MTTNIKFSHWFWITAVSVVLQGQIGRCIKDSAAKLLQVGGGYLNQHQPFTSE